MSREEIDFFGKSSNILLNGEADIQLVSAIFFRSSVAGLEILFIIVAKKI